MSSFSDPEMCAKNYRVQTRQDGKRRETEVVLMLVGEADDGLDALPKAAAAVWIAP